MKKFEGNILDLVDMKAYKEKTKAGLKDAEDTRIKVLFDEDEIRVQSLSYEDEIRSEYLIAQSKANKKK